MFSDSIKKFKLKISAAILLVALFSFCCKKKNNPTPEEPDQTFAKQEMLTNMSDNLILPAYTEFRTALDSLKKGYDVFLISQSVTDLKKVKSNFDAAYLKYQRISIFSFGPGEDENIRVNFNIFPTDTVQINKNILSGTYDLGSAANIAAKGFPALEFLFYGFNASEPSVAAAYSDPKRKKYASDLLMELSSKTNAVLTDWNSYRSTFVNSLSTDISSSIGLLVNQLNLELDNLKNSKLGIPLGLKSDGTIRPRDSEAFYSGQSKPYAIESLKAIENLYRGRSYTGKDGLGFDDYLDHLGAKREGFSLTAAINNQFTEAATKLALLGGPVPERVVSSPAEVEAAHTELVKLLVLLKTDMPSSLGVVITYQDGDGD